MRRLMAAGAVVAALALLTACSDDNPESISSTTSPTGVANATTAPSGNATGAPTGSPLPPLGSAKDKAACQEIGAKLSEWGLEFANAVAGIGNAGSDVDKVEVVVKKAKAANSSFAGQLRDVASKTKDAEVKKVANDMAAALEKMNGQLDAEKIAQDPGALSTAFDLPEYAAAADAFEMVCAGV